MAERRSLSPEFLGLPPLLWSLPSQMRGARRFWWPRAGVPQVADAIEALAGRLSPRALADLDVHMRRAAWAVDREEEAWTLLTPDAAKTLARALGDRVRAIGLLSMHRSGFVREAVLDELRAWTDGRELPVLALRANDWVDAVATLASDQLSRRLTPENCAAVVNALPALVRMLAQTRRDHQRVAASLRATLESHEALVLEAFDGFDRTTRLFVWNVFGRRATTSEAGIVRVTLADRDPLVRPLAIDALAQATDIHEAIRILQHLAIDDEAPLVRRRALTALAARSPDAARKVLPRAWRDASGSVRSLSRWLAQELDTSLDARAFYRQAISEGGRTSELLGPLAGLGETGSADDALAIEPFIQNPSPRLRVTAFRALAAVAPERAASRAVDGVGDSSPRVRRMALAILLAHAPDTFMAAVERLWTSASFAVRLDALRVTIRAPKWPALAVQLEALADPHAAIRAHAVTLVDDWLARFNDRNVAPSEAELSRVRQLAAAHGDRLSPESRRLLDFTVGVVG